MSDIKARQLVGEILTHIDIDPNNDVILLTTQSGRTIKVHHQATDGEWRNLIGKPLVDCIHWEARQP